MRRVPQSGRGQEVDVETGAMTDRLPAAEKLGELPQRLVGTGRAAELLLLDAGQTKNRLGHGAPGVHQSLHRSADAIGRESDGADLDHSVPGRVETGRLEIQSCVFRHGRSRFYVRSGAPGAVRTVVDAGTPPPRPRGGGCVLRCRAGLLIAL